MSTLQLDEGFLTEGLIAEDTRCPKCMQAYIVRGELLACGTCGHQPGPQHPAQQRLTREFADDLERRKKAEKDALARETARKKAAEAELKARGLGKDWGLFSLNIAAEPHMPAEAIALVVQRQNQRAGPGAVDEQRRRIIGVLEKAKADSQAHKKAVAAEQVRQQAEAHLRDASAKLAALELEEKDARARYDVDGVFAVRPKIDQARSAVEQAKVKLAECADRSQLLAEAANRELSRIREDVLSQASQAAQAAAAKAKQDLLADIGAPLVALLQASAVSLDLQQAAPSWLPRR
jgi:hypothetical protein